MSWNDTSHTVYSSHRDEGEDLTLPRRQGRHRVAAVTHQLRDDLRVDDGSAGGNLPAVVDVQRAARLIRDGQRVRVHGTDGYVELLT